LEPFTQPAVDIGVALEFHEYENNSYILELARCFLKPPKPPPSSRATEGRPGVHAGAFPMTVQGWIPDRRRFAACPG
ncbi:hypothetical protein, partial [Bosea sp. TAB14]|uniref:hypothetical protein n=1 Tax=Bosea sp. TAB14 TaxID=3237481 RepID=UPI003F908CD8